MKSMYLFCSCLLLTCTSLTAEIASDPLQEYLADLKKEIDECLTLPALKERLGFSAQDIARRGKEEISSFRNRYGGGYYEGDPNDISSKSTYAEMDYKGQTVSALYPCYLECIAPYVANKNVLEIGPGRGCWTKAILSHDPKSVTCLDALSASHNKFWEFIGHKDNVKYIQVTDFSLSEIPDDSIDYVFSFGTFCHISPLLIEEYIKNLYPKLRSGAKCFILYADYIKYADHYAVTYQKSCPNHLKRNEVELYRKKPSPLAFYHLGTNRAEAMLTELGYKDICADVGVNDRDPIMYFVKP